MAINWDDVRYRGDAQDVSDLMTEYRVADYLDAFEENRRKQEGGIREKLLKDGIRLSERLSPRIHRIYREVSAALQIESGVEVFCLPEQDVNAFALLDQRPDGPVALIGVTAGALEKLENTELRSILGHEFGHVLLGNNRLMALISTNESNPSLTVLPPLGESLFLRWRKKAELSADRVGLIASGSFAASARGLLKACFGLSERNLNLDVEALLAQIDELKGRPELIAAEFASHPLLPIRLKALELFSRSEKARRSGYPVEGEALSDERLEDGVDELIRLTRRAPSQPLPAAMMRCVAAGGAMLLAADREVNDEEVKVLVHVLHHFFTDEPEREIRTDPAEIEAMLVESAAVLAKDGENEDKLFVLSRLADVALADGALIDDEGGVILRIAELIGIPARQAYAILIGAAQAVGFRTDVRLNRIAGRLRESFQAGLKPTLTLGAPVSP